MFVYNSEYMVLIKFNIRYIKSMISLILLSIHFRFLAGRANIINYTLCGYNMISNKLI